MRTARASGDRRPRTDGTSTIPTSRTAGGLVGLAGRSRARLAAPARADGDRVVRARPGARATVQPTARMKNDATSATAFLRCRGRRSRIASTVASRACRDPEELHARAARSLRMPDIETWETWPFEGALRPRALLPPIADEEPRRGAGGVDCWSCAAADADYVWVDERWRLLAPKEPTGAAGGAPSDPEAALRRPGRPPRRARGRARRCLLARVERAIRSIGEIGRVHLCRWGDGSEHLHWWFWPGRRGSRSSTAASPRSGTTSSRRRP